LCRSASAKLEIGQLETLEIADQRVARLVALGQPAKIGAQLCVGGEKIAARAFLFDNQHTGPEQIDEAALARIEALHALLIDRDGASVDPENLEECVVEGVRLALFVMGALPVFAECLGPPPNLVPAQAHGQGLFPPSASLASALSTSHWQIEPTSATLNTRTAGPPRPEGKNVCHESPASRLLADHLAARCRHDRAI
jgi:hypothetical protein